MMSQVKEYRSQLIEKVAENSTDALMDTFLKRDPTSLPPLSISRTAALPTCE